MRHEKIAEHIQSLENALKVAGLWRTTPLPIEAYQSAQPFSVDTMSFVEWLQFVFIEKLTYLIQHALPLPNKSGIADMAEHYFAQIVLTTTSVDSKTIVEILREIDALLMQQ